jgi:hypothetical protein
MRQQLLDAIYGGQPFLDLVLVLVFTIAAVEVNGGSDGQPMGFPAIQTE